jgi:two-component system, LytTR family, response regulator
MTTLIVDDEPLARERLRTLLAAEPSVEIAGECANGRTALAAIRELAPDVVFLDVQMPEMDGFEVLERLGGESLPVIVFVTAFDKYAIRAFEVCALDYLLKPFDKERFQQTLARARAEHERRNAGEWTERLRSVLDELRARPRYADRLVVRSGGRVIFLRIEELDWAEAAGNYVRLHAGPSEYLYRETMAGLEAMLDPARFARVHRSAIVNVDRIQEMRPLFRGDFAVVLRGGKQLTLSRAYRDRLKV